MHGVNALSSRLRHTSAAGALTLTAAAPTCRLVQEPRRQRAVDQADVGPHWCVSMLLLADAFCMCCAQPVDVPCCDCDGGAGCHTQACLTYSHSPLLQILQPTRWASSTATTSPPAACCPSSRYGGCCGISGCYHLPWHRGLVPAAVALWAGASAAPLCAANCP